MGNRIATIEPRASAAEWIAAVHKKTLERPEHVAAREAVRRLASEAAARSEESRFYDIRLQFSRVDDIVEKGFELQVLRPVTDMTCPVVAIQGHFNVGKTWFISKLGGCVAPSGDDVHTKGVCVKVIGDTASEHFVILDNEGLNSPVVVEVGDGVTCFDPLSLQHKKTAERFQRELTMGLAGTVLFVVGHLSHLDQCDILNMINDDSDLAASKAVVVVHNLRGMTDKVKFEVYRDTIAESFAAQMVVRTVDGCYRLEGISEGLCPRLTQFFLANDDMQWGREQNAATVRAVRSALSKSSKVDILGDFLSRLEQVLPRYFFTNTLLTVEVRSGNRLALKLPPGAPVPEISLLGIQASAAMPTPIRLRELCKSSRWYIFPFEAAGVVDVRNLVLESASGRHRLKFEVDVSFTAAPASLAVEAAVTRYNSGTTVQTRTTKRPRRTASSKSSCCWRCRRPGSSACRRSRRRIMCGNQLRSRTSALATG